MLCSRHFNFAIFFISRNSRKLTCQENFISFPGIMVLLVRIDIRNFIVEDVLGCLSVVTITITSGNDKFFYGWSDAVTKRTQTFNFMPIFARNFSIIGGFFKF